MTSEERHTESVRRLSAIETKLDGLAEGQKAMDQRLTGVERKINYFSGGVAVVVTVEVTFTGRAVNGREAAFDAVDVFDLRDSRIAALSTWYDLVAARAAVSG